MIQKSPRTKTIENFNYKTTISVILSFLFLTTGVKCCCSSSYIKITTYTFFIYQNFSYVKS